VIDETPLVEAKILRLEPGDIIALRVADELSPDQAKLLQEAGKAAFPGHDVAVLSGGIDLVVVREPEPM
jgi:hypothetical protein